MNKDSKDKPWMHLEEQLAILKRRGMNIDDDSKAISYLDKIGYYRLSGYWLKCTPCLDNNFTF